MRGKPGVEACEAHGVRIIPAHAGQTTTDASRLPIAPDHPRACGANRVITPFRPVVAGSSPRMRGKHDEAAVSDEQRRIIPAHAGQTFVLCFSLFLLSDHPRACGANLESNASSCCATGSSPRMRGKLRYCRQTPPDRRIIPAHAGQTRPRWPEPISPTDHPRACGANDHPALQTVILLGSSPRMRGKLHHGAVDACAERIIPAHAGQTRRSAELRVRTSDHPRACGANHRKSKQSSA